MATEKIAMGINLRKNKNESSSGYGNYYPKDDVSSAVTTKTFTKSSGGGGGEDPFSE